MTDNPVHSFNDDGILTVRLARPAKMNALSPTMIADLHRLFVAAADDATVRCLLIEAEGKAFCAGRDLGAAEANEDAERILADSVNPMLQALYNFPKPSIAAVNGVAMGIGLGLALACDIVYAGESARFSSPFANLGGALDSGGHYFLPRLLSDNRALELIYTARVLDGRTAEHWGLVNRAMPDAVLTSTARRLAQRIADGPATAYAGQKALLRQSHALDFAAVLAAEARLQGALSHTAEYAEGIAAFQQKRRPDFRASGGSLQP